MRHDDSADAAPTSTIPEHWRNVALGEIADHALGKMLDQGKNVGESQPYLRNLNVRWGNFDLTDVKEMRIRKSEHERFAVKRGDLLVCEGGEPGRCAVWTNDRKIYFQKALHRVRPSAVVSAEYLAYFIRYSAVTHKLDTLFTGSTIKHLPGVKLAQLRVPLPPRLEQDHIVHCIEELFTMLASCERDLDLAEQLTHKHRAADFAHICFGIDARSSRRAAWDNETLPSIPDGWRWSTVGDIAATEPRAITDGPFGSNLKTSHYTDEGPRVIRLQNIGEGTFVDQRTHISEAHMERLKAHEAMAGDVIVAALGEALPRACVVPSEVGPAIVKADCQRIRVGPDMDPHFLCAVLNSAPIRRQAAGLVSGVGRQRLSLAKLKKLRIPVPPVGDQRVAAQKLQHGRAAEGIVRDALRQSRADIAMMRASVLHRAFSGCLVSSRSVDVVSEISDGHAGAIA